MWTLCVGSTLVFGPILGKTWRLYRVFTQRVPDKRVVGCRSRSSYLSFQTPVGSVCFSVTASPEIFQDKGSNHRAADRHHFGRQIYLLRQLNYRISLNKFGGFTVKLFNLFSLFFCMGFLLCLNGARVVQDCNNRFVLGFRSLETSSWWGWWLCCSQWTRWSSQPGTLLTPSAVHDLWLLLSRYCLFVCLFVWSGGEKFEM